MLVLIWSNREVNGPSALVQEDRKLRVQGLIAFDVRFGTSSDFTSETFELGLW
jgi:hypothetical protein